MLYFALVVGLSCYGALFFMWAAMQPHLQRPTIAPFWLRDLVVAMPDAGMMSVLKQVMLLVAIYLFVDFVIASVKRLLSPRHKALSINNLHTVTVQQGRTTGFVLTTAKKARRAT